MKKRSRSQPRLSELFQLPKISESNPTAKVSRVHQFSAFMTKFKQMNSYCFCQCKKVVQSLNQEETMTKFLTGFLNNRGGSGYSAEMRANYRKVKERLQCTNSYKDMIDIAWEYIVLLEEQISRGVKHLAGLNLRIPPLASIVSASQQIMRLTCDIMSVSVRSHSLQRSPRKQKQEIKELKTEMNLVKEKLTTYLSYKEKFEKGKVLRNEDLEESEDLNINVEMLESRPVTNQSSNDQSVIIGRIQPVEQHLLVN